MWLSFCLRPKNHFKSNHSFTLLEVLITLAIVAVILVAVLDFVDVVAQTWKAAGTDSFAEAQDAFDSIAQNLAEATLEPYQDYADVHGAFRTNGMSGFVPDHPSRRSDLAFACGPSGGPTGWLTPSGRTTTGSCVFFMEPAGYTILFDQDGHATQVLCQHEGFITRRFGIE